ncbi:cytidine deaminase [Spiroplasma helicoides]|uniref:Cytidine deaminase n=1 Tax=Spiroplasma helicoides TaxID=216938 RepID=A0A1B3SL16_9MOLU|nr:cytidine deaminase [Spiroplasma helicoides]AOG60624.1 cytidine deaminase [Spiroplasma helicoides]
MKNEDILKELLVLKENSYSPYSNFKVACIIYLKNGKKIKGVNVENAAYNPTICAERTALSQMITKGFGKEDVDFVTLYTDSSKFGSPCGTCRQTLYELLKKSQTISFFNKNGFLGSYSVSELLPYAFNNDNLKDK